jgi:predicted 2-oxoglutarate/Fe(II)-dependent dioxygenase YbiX
MQYDEVASGVLTVRLYDPPAASSIVEQVRAHGGWADAQIRSTAAAGFESRTDADVRTARILEAPAMPRSVLEGFERRLDEVVKPVVNERWRAGLTEHSGTQVIGYGPGGHYLAHIDAGQDYRNRYFSVVCYLNDDFGGGRTLFPSLGLAVEPASGVASVFPADYVHSAEPVTRGEKYVVVTWIVGPTPVDWI